MSLPIIDSATEFLRGDLVEVRSWAEIVATLDATGCCDGMPFMQEMARFCGHRFRVHRRADKTCVEGHRIRRLADSVFLEGVRCDGATHDGCQRGCLIFWKTAWLRAVDDTTPAATVAEPPAAELAARLAPAKNGRYRCQSTALADATVELSRFSLRSYVDDIRHGEATVGRLLGIVWRMAKNKVLRRLGRTIAGNQQKPSKGDLGLQAGEWVEVKSRPEIEATLDPDGKNRGLSFEIEMLEHCGRRYQVAYPIRRIINEVSGQMIELTHTVVLDGVTCEGLCSRNCPRNNFFYWREIWLTRCPPPQA